jgi:hypothetical protein
VKKAQRPQGQGAPNLRGSPEAVEKRRAARLFNKVLRGEPGGGGDGRTERRRRRLLAELAKGTARGGKRELKPIDVLTRVQELLALGEPLPSLEKACPPPRPIDATPEVLEGIRRIHKAYGFPVEVYAFVGIDGDTLRRAGVPAAPPGLAPLTAPTGPAPPTAPPRPGLQSAGPRQRLTRHAARG